MNSSELRKKLLDFRSFYTNVHEWIMDTEKKVKLLESIPIDCGQAIREGLRVRVQFE